jgi:hypothetical protein
MGQVSIADFVGGARTGNWSLVTGYWWLVVAGNRKQGLSMLN